MQFPNNLNLKPANVLKIAGLALVAIIIIVLAFRLIGSLFKTSSSQTGGQSLSSRGEIAYDKTEEMALSIRNVASPAVAPTQNNAVKGDDAEEFEVTEYNATIETRDKDKNCALVAGLKAQADIIFENASEHDRGCNYTFKVKKNKVNEVLLIIKNLKPQELLENVYTIKQVVNDYTSETEILTKKLASIDETLNKAVSAYDNVTVLATRVQDVESLAKIIDSKINIIERLTQERININSQLERIERVKAEQLDRLEYTYFQISIFENKFIDGENLRASWKAAVKEFVRDINQVIQDISINLVALLFYVLQYVIYFLILLVIVKYGWRVVKYIWRK
jgi:hypothetical protein